MGGARILTAQIQLEHEDITHPPDNPTYPLHAPTVGSGGGSSTYLRRSSETAMNSLPNLSTLPIGMPKRERPVEQTPATVGEVEEQIEREFSEVFGFERKLEFDQSDDILTSIVQIDQLFSALLRSWQQNKVLAEEIARLVGVVYANGFRPLVQCLLKRGLDKFSLAPVCRPAHRTWWNFRPPVPDDARLKLKREADGSVIVDLWHARRGKNKEVDSFQTFIRGHPTFFMSSLGYMRKHLDELQDYVGEAEARITDTTSDDHNIFVKRGRFKFKPLLWFDDLDAGVLRSDTVKAETISRMVKTHIGYAKNPSFDMNKMPDKQWGRILYAQSQVELRLDNNCVEFGEIALDRGFGGTLAVDVSGMAAALGVAPGLGRNKVASDSIVLWDPAAALVEEGDWEYFPE